MAQLVAYETRPCVVCGKSDTLSLDAGRFAAWKSGVFVQDAFPEMTNDERELLITGTHPACWTKLFPPEED